MLEPEVVVRCRKADLALVKVSITEWCVTLAVTVYL